LGIDWGFQGKRSDEPTLPFFPNKGKETIYEMVNRSKMVNTTRYYFNELGTVKQQLELVFDFVYQMKHVALLKTLFEYSGIDSLFFKHVHFGDAFWNDSKIRDHIRWQCYLAVSHNVKSEKNSNSSSRNFYRANASLASLSRAIYTAMNSARRAVTKATNALPLHSNLQSKIRASAMPNQAFVRL
jgi:hypothetical protein